jgi:hypothetical protein
MNNAMHIERYMAAERTEQACPQSSVIRGSEKPELCIVMHLLTLLGFRAFEPNAFCSL